MKIRENEKKHLEELKSWLASQRETPLEEMDGFFAARVNIYDKHMSVWAKAYERLPDYLPAGTKRLLDLGVGTGLELESIYRRFPSAELVGIDLSETMLAELRRKYPEKGIKTVCADYFTAELGTGYDAAVSVESLHHFTAEKNRGFIKEYSTLCVRAAAFFSATISPAVRKKSAFWRRNVNASGKRERFAKRNSFISIRRSRSSMKRRF